MKYKNCPVHFEAKEFKLKNIFKISRGSKSKIRTLELRIAKNHCVGRGECVPYKRYNENLSKITKILRNKKNINNLSSIKSLPLRNALSNAIYDLKLKTKKIKYSNIIKKNNFNTAITIPIYNEKKFTSELKKLKNIKYLKIKLNKNKVFNYLKIIKKYSSKSKIIIDANESWTVKFLIQNENKFRKYNILFIEQPIKSNRDHKLSINLPLCADESFHAKYNYKKIKKIYKWVNIKPDKFGSEADVYKTIKYARKNKLKIFLGCMVSSSLSIIPSLKYAKYCDVLDLDGPLFLKKDYKYGLKYKKGYLIYNKKFNYGF
tara:strand:+ start:125 stop:1078 length:954 start_codon:yes stop_codon:yes gene_type:complete